MARDDAWGIRCGSERGERRSILPSLPMTALNRETAEAHAAATAAGRDSEGGTGGYLPRLFANHIANNHGNEQIRSTGLACAMTARPARPPPLVIGILIIGHLWSLGRDATEVSRRRQTEPDTRRRSATRIETAAPRASGRTAGKPHCPVGIVRDRARTEPGARTALQGRVVRFTSPGELRCCYRPRLH